MRTYLITTLIFLVGYIFSIMLGDPSLYIKPDTNSVHYSFKILAIVILMFSLNQAFNVLNLKLFKSVKPIYTLCAIQVQNGYWFYMINAVVCSSAKQPVHTVNNFIIVLLWNTATFLIWKEFSYGSTITSRV